MNTSARRGESRNLAAISCAIRLSVSRFDSDNLDVDGGWSSHADHGIHKASRREEWRDLRHFGSQLRFDARDIFVAADAVTRLEPNLHKAGMHRRIRRIDCGESVIHADVIDDDSQVLRLNNSLHH